MPLINDERGFLDLYFLTIFTILLLVFFGVLAAAILGCRKNAVASYGWFVEASDFAMHAANLNGIASNPEGNQLQVREYFDSSFDGVMQATDNSDEYDPNPGSPFQGKGPIMLDDFTPEIRGDSLPNGTIADADGYWITITVPVLNANLSFFGTAVIEAPVKVPMSYFAEL